VWRTRSGGYDRADTGVRPYGIGKTPRICRGAPQCAPVLSHMHYDFPEIISDRLKKRIGRNRVEAKIGWLKGYALTFDKLADNGSGYANLQPVETETVYGVLYKLTEEELQKLDRCEGVPSHYVRRSIEVETEQGRVQAECYVASEEKIQKGLKPRRDYLDHLIKGAQEHGLPPEYIAKLRSIESL